MSSARVTAELRRLVIARAKYCCEYCVSQVAFSAQSFSVEHIIPKHKSGPTSLDNLALACQGCNGSKHIKTEGSDPITQQAAPFFHPRKHLWQEHFVWNEDYTLMLGVTPIGRVTIVELKLNRGGVVNLRGALFAIRKHPPI